MHDQRRANDRSRGWRAANLPLPEAHLVGVAAVLGLHRVRRSTLPGDHRVYSVAGSALSATAMWLIARSVTIAGQVDLDRPRTLVTAGPYAVCRNPMYVGWALLHLGIGLVARNGWTGLTLPAAAAWVHGEVLREERRLAARFGAEFAEYQAAVPRYLPLRRLMVP